MKQNIKEAAMDYMHHNEHNFMAADKKVVLNIFGNKVEAESIWYSDKEDKIYLHVGCPEFEGDLDIDQLSDENQWMLLGIFTGDWERFEGVTEPMELEFFSIEDDGKGGKQIHVMGYLYTNGEDYGDGEWRNVEYTGFIEPLEDFIRHYAEDNGYVDNTAGELKQYIGDKTDEEVVDIINNYFGGKPADYLMEYCEIDMDTPCGNYCFEF